MMCFHNSLFTLYTSCQTFHNTSCMLTLKRMIIVVILSVRTIPSIYNPNILLRSKNGIHRDLDISIEPIFLDLGTVERELIVVKKLTQVFFFFFSSLFCFFF